MPCLLWISCCLCLSAGMVGFCVGSSCPHLDHPICSPLLSLPCRTCCPLISITILVCKQCPYLSCLGTPILRVLFRTSLEKLRIYAACVPAFLVSLALMRPGYGGLDRRSRGQAASHKLLRPCPHSVRRNHCPPPPLQRQ